MNSLDIQYLRMAFMIGNISKSIRKKVGCVIVNYHNNIPHLISDGVNGTTPGEDNSCESDTGETLPSVVHAEINAIEKINYLITKHNLLDLKLTLYVNFQPCDRCCNSILEFNRNNNHIIKRVVYCYGYKETLGIEKLRENGISVEQISMNDLSIELSSSSYSYYDVSGYLRLKGYSESEINKEIISLSKKI